VGGSGAYPELHVCHSWIPPIRHSNRLNVGSATALKANVAGPLTGWFGPFSVAIAGAVSSTKRARSWRSALVAN
jgi:hypothetical protein